MPVIQLSGDEIFYEVDGDGDPLVLIPGFASGSWSWAWQIEELAQTFRVLTFDPRGISRSTAADEAVASIESIANDVAILLDTLNVVSAYVLGISFGGFVAQEFALRFPKRVKRLVLASTSFGGPNHVAPSAEVMEAFTSMDGLNSSERVRQYLTMAFSEDFVRTSPETVERFCRLREENEVQRDVYARQLQSAVSFDIEKRVGQIGAETLVLTGDNDVIVPVQNSRNLADALPRARLEIIPGTGHMGFVEKSVEFNRIVRDFLAASE